MVMLDEAGRANGWTRLIAPPPWLEPFVEFLWMQTGVSTEAGSGGWRIVPDAAPHLIVTRGRSRPAMATRAVLVGARSHHVDSDMRSRTWTAGVRLRPGVLPLLTGLPAADFADRSARPADVWGNEGEQLEADLAVAPGPDHAMSTVLAVLRRRLGRAAPPDPRVGALVRGVASAHAGRPDRRHPSVRDLAHTLGIAERTLRFLCADHVGLSPVLALRVQRLHHAIRLAQRPSRGGWASVAAMAGFFDQSHLIRDFRLLLGETPQVFMARGVSSKG